MRWRPTASSSIAPIRTRRRRCRRTPPCLSGGCRSRPACATTWVHRQAERAPAAAAAARARLHHRRRSSPPICCARIPASARASTSSTLTCRRYPGNRASATSSATVRRLGSHRRALARCAALVARVPVPSSVRAAQALRAAGAFREYRPTTAKSRTPTKSSAAWSTT